MMLRLIFTSFLPVDRQVQHVPLAEYRSNLEAMVQMARQAGIKNILLLTPPPVHDEGRIKHQQQVNHQQLQKLC